MSEQRSFVRWLKQLRATHDLTQDALAELVGCAPQTLRMFERGSRRPSRDLAERMANVLGVPTDERDTFVRLARAKGDTAGTVAEQPQAAAPRAVPIPAPATPRASQLGAVLPLPQTPLIGREREQTEVIRLLTANTCRLLTLVGSGGIGKTRLAIQVASNLAPRFADGVAFVPLATVAAAEGVAAAIADAIGCRFQGPEALEDQLLLFLHERELLLLVDNMEHLLDASTLLGRLVGEAPGVRLLVTSRERLRLQAEWVVELGGLAVPADDTPERIVRAEAVLLFLERARRAASDFVIGPHNQATVAAICRRLDGVPLALELAAARVKALPPAALLQRLDRALPLLVDGARDLPERQRTMRATLAWSYDLLDDDERALFQRLAVFTGGFSLEAAEAVGAGGDIHTGDVLLLLGRLVDRSLIVTDTTMAEAVRYRLLEPVRQYALELLDESGAVAEVRGQHAAFFLALAEAEEPCLTGSEQVASLERLGKQYPNLRAAMDWFLARSDVAAVARLGWALWLFLWMRGHFSEGRRWMEAVLVQAPDMPPALRAHVLLTACVLAYGQADYERAAPLAEESLELYRGLGDANGIAYATGMAGLIAIGLKQYERGGRLIEEGVVRHLDVGNTWSAAMLLTYSAAIPLKQGDYASATHLTEQALVLARKIGDRIGVYASLYNLASVAQARGDQSEATRLFREALALSVEMGDEGNSAYCLEELAAVVAARGQLVRAARLWGAAEALLAAGEAAVYAHTPDRSLYEHKVSAARAQLDERTWAEAWACGRAMPFEQVVADAMADEAVSGDETRTAAE